MVDAGNALFRAEGVQDAALREKAAFILRTMGALGTRVMAAGARDLNAGASFLKEQAKKAQVEVLSANLVDAKGKPVFPGSRVLEVAGLRVGFVGLSPMGKLGPAAEGLQGRPPLVAAVAEARKLRGKADLVVVLAAVPYADSLQLSGEAKGLVDFIIQSHDARGVTPMQKGEGNFVLSGGERGRQLGQLGVDTRGKGPFVDLAEAKRQQWTLENLERNIAEVKKRLEATSDKAAKEQLAGTLKAFTDRRAQTLKALGAQSAEGRKTVQLDYVNLGSEVPGDPTLEAEARKYEASGAH